MPLGLSPQHLSMPQDRKMYSRGVVHKHQLATTRLCCDSSGLTHSPSRIFSVKKTKSAMWGFRGAGPSPRGASTTRCWPGCSQIAQATLQHHESWGTSRRETPLWSLSGACRCRRVSHWATRPFFLFSYLRRAFLWGFWDCTVLSYQSDFVKKEQFRFTFASRKAVFSLIFYPLQLQRHQWAQQGKFSSWRMAAVIIRAHMGIPGKPQSSSLTFYFLQCNPCSDAPQFAVPGYAMPNVNRNMRKYEE